MAIQLHLKDILNYEDLKSQVFQLFRELGNTLALFHVLGASVSQWDSFTFVQSASFLGVTPDLCKYTSDSVSIHREGDIGEETDCSESVPLVHHVHKFVSQAKQCVGVMQGPALDSLVEFSHRTAMLYGGHKARQESTEEKESRGLSRSLANATREPLLRVALKFLKDALDEADAEMRAIAEEGGDTHSNLWDDDDNPVNGVMYVDTTQAFHRLFSTILFEFCEISRSPISVDLSSSSCSQENQEGGNGNSSCVTASILPDSVEFGDGILWGGGAIIHMLKQTEVFRLLDFSGHVLGVSEWEGLHESSMVGTVDNATMKALPLFLRNARLAHYRIDQLFKLFEAQRALPIVDELVVFKPPLDDSPEKMGLAQVNHVMTIELVSHLRSASGSSVASNRPSVYGHGMSAITENTLNYEVATQEDRFVSEQEDGNGLSEGWRAEIDPDSGDTFFVNVRTGQTTWDRVETFQ